MANSIDTLRQVLAAVQANRLPGLGDLASELKRPPAEGSSQPNVNESAIVEHAATYGEPVDPGLAAVLAGVHSSGITAATMAPAPKRNTATVARAILSAAMASDDDESWDAPGGFSASSESSSGSQEFSKKHTGTAAERKARLMNVAEEASYDHPPSKDDIMQMQGKPLKVVLQRLRIRGMAIRLAVKRFGNERLFTLVWTYSWLPALR